MSAPPCREITGAIFSKPTNPGNHYAANQCLTLAVSKAKKVRTLIIFRRSLGPKHDELKKGPATLMTGTFGNFVHCETSLSATPTSEITVCASVNVLPRRNIHSTMENTTVLWKYPTFLKISEEKACLKNRFQKLRGPHKQTASIRGLKWLNSA